MRYPMIASYTWVLPLFNYPIGLRPETLFASGEPFCVGYLLSPGLCLVRLGGMDPCPQAPNKRPHTQNASLRSMRLDRRTHWEHRVRPGVTFFFCWCKRTINIKWYQIYTLFWAISGFHIVITLQIGSYSRLDSSLYGIPRGNQSETRQVYLVYYW